jgi:hypothetical protein
MVRLRRLLTGASVLFVFAVLGWMFYLEFSYTESMPRQRDSGSGRVVPMVINHGHHIFVTDAEARRLQNAELFLKIGGPLGGLGILLANVDALWLRRRKS